MMTREEAIAFCESKKWQEMTNWEIAQLQFGEQYLCVPFSRFHEAVEWVLCRPVWTHEFVGEEGRQRLIDEMEGKRPKGTIQESFDMLVNLAKDKDIIVVEVP